MEVILSIGIIAVIGVFSSTLLTRTYNSTDQAESISKLKQNGQQILNVLTDSIRMADGVVCTGTFGITDGTTRNNYIVIRDSQGNFTRFWFIEPLLTSGQVTTNGYLARQDNLDPDDFPTFCIADPSPNSTNAISNNFSKSGVSVSSGNFTRIPGNEGKDTINIVFNLSPSLTAYNVSTGQTMQTTIKVR